MSELDELRGSRDQPRCVRGSCGAGRRRRDPRAPSGKSPEPTICSRWHVRARRLVAVGDDHEVDRGSCGAGRRRRDPGHRPGSDRDGRTLRGGVPERDQLSGGRRGRQRRGGRAAHRRRDRGHLPDRHGSQRPLRGGVPERDQLPRGRRCHLPPGRRRGGRADHGRHTGTPITVPGTYHLNAVACPSSRCAWRSEPTPK